MISVTKIKSKSNHSISLLRLAACMCLPFFVSACVTDTPKLDPNFKEVSAPTTRKVGYDDVLYEFGKMLRAYTGNTPDRPIYIQSKQIPNDTAAGGLPNNISQMVVTTLTKIGGPLVYVPYDPQYLTNEINMGHGVVVRKNPDVVVAGAITEFDKDLVSQSETEKLSFSPPIGGKIQPDLDVSKGNRNDASRLAIDFSILDYKTQSSISAPTSNTIDIKKSTQTGGFSFGIYGMGLGVEGSVTQSQGIHAAIRSLVEVSLIQLLGRAYHVPYWKLLPGASEDTRLTETVLEDFHGGSSEKLIEWMLKAYGNCPGEYPAGEAGMVDLLNKIGKDHGKDYHLTSIASVTDAALMDVYYNIPTNDYLAQCRKREALQKAAPEQASAAAKGPKEALSLTLSSDKGSKPQYKVGDPIKITVGTSSNSHVYCYWEQGNGTTIRVFPNRFHESSSVQGGKKISVPDDSMPFLMKTEFPNSNEKIGCFASSTDASGKLPAPIIEKDLSEMSGIHISDISAAFSKIGDSSLAAQYLNITVR